MGETVVEQVWLADHPTVANTIRVVYVFVGFVLGGVALKIGLRSARYGDWERFWGAFSFTCIIATPGIITLLRLDAALLPLPTVVYGLGLLGGIIAFGYRYAIWPAWKRRAAADLRRRTRGR